MGSARSYLPDNNGAVYVDTNPLIPLLLEKTYILKGRQTHANQRQGFEQAYFNSELDAMEASISRQALLTQAGMATLIHSTFKYSPLVTAPKIHRLLDLEILAEEAIFGTLSLTTYCLCILQRSKQHRRR